MGKAGSPVLSDYPQGLLWALDEVLEWPPLLLGLSHPSLPVPGAL